MTISSYVILQFNWGMNRKMPPHETFLGTNYYDYSVFSEELKEKI